MAASSFSFLAAHPWRMLLFGVLGCLLPLAAYLISWGLLDGDLRGQYRQAFDWMLIPVLLLSGILTYLGFRFSSAFLTVGIDEKGMLKKIKPRLFFLPRREEFIAWEELREYSYTEDSRGKILKIRLKGGRAWTIAQVYALDRSAEYELFYQAFLLHIQGREQVAGEKEGPDFYHSKKGRIIAWLLLFLMAVVAVLPIIRGEPMSGWQWFRLCFFEVAGGVYVFRSLVWKG